MTSARSARAVLAGDLDGPLEEAVVLGAGVRLYAAGLAEEPRAAVERGRAVLRDGLATEVLEALVG